MYIADLETILQFWTSGKESGIWVSLVIVLGFFPLFVVMILLVYRKLGYEQDAVERGFFVHENERQIV